MSEFEKWFRSLNANGKTVYFLGNEHKVSEMAWNHQQAKIDELQARISVYEKHVKAIKHIHETQFDENTDTSFILGNLDGFIEHLESDLKGNKDEN